MIRIFVGYDEREPAAYHAFCESVVQHASQPVSFTPLARRAVGHLVDGRRDGSNAFTYSRFLVPLLCDFSGWALYADGDMVCLADVAELWAMRDPWRSVQVVKHDYRTRHPVKYLGAENKDYPGKNWSSLVLWNCGSYLNRCLTEDVVAGQSGEFLHRFAWLLPERIGVLPKEWNWLVDEYPHNDAAKILHYTVGTPCFDEFVACDHAAEWHAAQRAMNRPVDFVNTALSAVPA